MASPLPQAATASHAAVAAASQTQASVFSTPFQNSELQPHLPSTFFPRATGMRGQVKKLSFFKKLRLLFQAPGDKKLWLAALLAGLGYFISVFGLHRLYLGYHTEGLLQLGGEALGLVLVFAGVLATVGAPPSRRCSSWE